MDVNITTADPLVCFRTSIGTCDDNYDLSASVRFRETGPSNELTGLANSEKLMYKLARSLILANKPCLTELSGFERHASLFCSKVQVVSWLMHA